MGMLEQVADWRLVIQTGPLTGTTVEIPLRRFTLGRDPACDLKLDDPKSSRQHAWIEPDGEYLVVQDNRSTNGVYVNGERVERRRLAPGDVIRIGGTEIALRELSDFAAISFYDSEESSVTAQISLDAVTNNSLAEKLTQYLDLCKMRDTAQAGQREALKRAERFAGILKSLFAVSGQMSRLLPTEELLRVVAKALFDSFSGAENIVIMLRDKESGRVVPKFVSNRAGERDPVVNVSRTALMKAMELRTTIVANDAEKDARFANSDSIVGFHLKALMCAPLVVGEETIGAIYVDNRQKNVFYDEMDAELVTAFANQAAVAINNARLMDNIQESYHQTLQALVRAIEAKDPYTSGHSQRVRDYALGIATELGFDAARLKRLSMAAELHDIGKIGVHEKVINKPGGLTDTEFESVKMHVEMGEKILKPIAYMADLLPWIRGHHEKWDGTGYPDRLKGEECPVEGRILAAADAFDAMTSKRTYNNPLSTRDAIERLRKGAGTHFDPAIVAAFEMSLKSDTARSEADGLETIRKRPPTEF